MNWQNIFRLNNEIVISTVSQDLGPHAAFVLSKGFTEDKLLIGAGSLKKTVLNLKKDPRVCITAKSEGKYLRIKGKAEIFTKGKYFDLAYQRSNPPMPKAAILISVEEVYDLDNSVYLVK